MKREGRWIHRLICAAGLLTLLTLPVAAGAFNLAQYNAGDLDQILAEPRQENGIKLLSPQKLRFEVSLLSYAESCDTGFLRRSMVMLGAPQQVVDTLPVSECIQVKTAKGNSTTVYIQDKVAGFLPQEVPLGSALSIFGDLLFLDKDGPGILVNEFQVKEK